MTSLRTKVEHVKSASQSRAHTCHWPGCTRQVPPAMWGCRDHWLTLPQSLRTKIWTHYRPRQELDLRPSAEYIAAALGPRMDRPELRSREMKAIPLKEHQVVYQELVDLVKKHSDDVTPKEMLMIASNTVGKILAMQDQRTLSPEDGMKIIARNIEQGNEEAIQEITKASGRSN